MVDLARMRLEYENRGLDPAEVAAEPVDQFESWLAEAVSSEVTEPNAMVIATVDAAGRPHTRNVLCKGVSHAPDGRAGLEFYTNYRSAKAAELAADDRISATFGWLELHRQVTFRGTAHRLTAAENDAYFAVRPRGSQLGAWASPQSEPVADRSVLDDALAEVTARYGGDDAEAPDARPVDRPPHWGGYRIIADEVEFWQGRTNRLHDRVRYTLRNDGTWSLTRLGA